MFVMVALLSGGSWVHPKRTGSHPPELLQPRSTEANIRLCVSGEERDVTCVNSQRLNKTGVPNVSHQVKIVCSELQVARFWFTKAGGFEKKILKCNVTGSVTNRKKIHKFIRNAILGWNVIFPQAQVRHKTGSARWLGEGLPAAIVSQGQKTPKRPYFLKQPCVKHLHSRFQNTWNSTFPKQTTTILF